MTDKKTINQFVLLASALAFFYLINLISTANVMLDIGEKIEANRPADIELIQIIDPACTDCASLSNIIEQLRGKSSLNITSTKVISYTSQQGRELADKFGFRKLPALVIVGEVEKSNVQWDNDWLLRDSAVLFDSAVVPYRDMLTNELVGLVSLTEIRDSSCEKCYDMNSLISFFKQSGVKFAEEKRVEYTNENVEKVPSLILSSNIIEYPAVAQIWNQLGAKKVNDTYVIGSSNPPYVEVESGTVKGLASVIYISDNSCSSCYNVSANKDIIEGMGVYIANDTFLNIDDATELISLYNITKVPMILISPEVALYNGFSDIWKNVGSVEEDGWYVMRKPEVLGEINDI